MMLPLRPLFAYALTLCLFSGCDGGTPGPAEDAGPQLPVEDSGVPDAGPWDGSYTVLEERGEWQDRGRLAPCSVRTEGFACDSLSPSQFELTGCNPAALAGLEPHGIYQAEVRTEALLADGGVSVTPTALGFMLHSDGGTDILSGSPLVARQTDGGTFFIASRRGAPFNLATAFAGCDVPSPGVITGCYARCQNGRLTRTGTFEAQRMTWPAGEGESSGGLQLLSESPVARGRPVDVYVAKNHAYVVSLRLGVREGGLTVFDVSDPRHPVLKTSFHLPGDSEWNGVWAKGDALYIASADRGVLVYNISNPGAPDFVRSLPGGDFYTHTVFVDGDRLYAASGDATVVFDVSSPLAPVLRQSISVPDPNGLTFPHDVFTYGDRLYISNSQGGYSVMDVRDLEDVRHLGQYFYAGGYAHHSEVGTFAGRTIAFEGGELMGSHLRVLDVTDPARIVKIGEFKKRRVTSLHNFILKGTRLYVAWYAEGVRVLDVSNPTKPREVAHYNTFRETDPGRTSGFLDGAYGMRVPGDGHVYVVDSSRGLLVLNEL